ncbi:site-specific DNA-methyltransferase [Nitrosomonas sp.]|uniref:DNA methyltransferase n=2 Tax=Nitrosomonas sp. TaxID=42353 RepID=UPI0025E21971|nr:site-specific DNA-methyltransferase [Nitrosomonas sp.]
MIKAFRDTWELGIHSYLNYLRDRLLLAKELLHESGSVFVQISDENLHHVREICDEILGVENFVSQISFSKAAGGLQAANRIGAVLDYIVWYAKDATKSKFRRLYFKKGEPVDEGYTTVALPGGYFQTMKEMGLADKGNIPPQATLAMSVLMTKPGPGAKFQVEYCGKIFDSGNRWWGTTPEGLERVKKSLRAIPTPSSIRLAVRFDDFPYGGYQNLWSGFGGAANPVYVVQTNADVLQRCLLMTTDPGDLVLDPTCGSGTTAFVAEKWGRRWITADTSRVAVTLAKQRLMTASYDYFELKYPHEGLRSGFIYKTVPHVTLKFIANNPEIDEIYARMHPAVETALAALNAILPDSASFPRRRESKVFVASLDSRLRGNDDSAGQSGNDDGLKEWQVPFDFPVDWPEAAKKPFDAFHAARQTMQKQMDASIAAHAGQEILYDQPAVSKSKLRITGPFTVEAVPFATVLGLDEAEQPKEADIAVARSGATWRQSQWRDELLKAGIRGKGGQKIQLLDLVPLPGAKYIHAIGTVADTGDKVAVSFGPEHAALEQRQVEIAMREAGELFPLPKMLVFCAFTFDPEAAKDIDTIKGITALRVQMNTDLLTEDLKKGRASNESFWLMGQPDVVVKQIKAGCYQVEVRGFDYFDTKTGELKSGGKKNIAMWALDTDYDNRSLFPRQVFFPMAGSGDGWNKLRKDIRAELNEELLEQFHGTVSLPFEAGENECIAVKIVDDRGIESLKVINLDRISV